MGTERRLPSMSRCSFKRREVASKLRCGTEIPSLLCSMCRLNAATTNGSFCSCTSGGAQQAWQMQPCCANVRKSASANESIAERTRAAPMGRILKASQPLSGAFFVLAATLIAPAPTERTSARLTKPGSYPPPSSCALYSKRIQKRPKSGFACMDRRSCSPSFTRIDRAF